MRLAHTRNITPSILMRLCTFPETGLRPGRDRQGCSLGAGSGRPASPAWPSPESAEKLGGDLRRCHMDAPVTAAAAGTIDVGGDLTVNRMGFGAMRITGAGIWKDPPDRDQAKAALRRAVELEV